jgi:hypothetical protein
MMSRKSTKLQPWQKLLTVTVSGKPVTIAATDATLGEEIYMYRLSTHTSGKSKPVANGGVVKANQRWSQS